MYKIYAYVWKARVFFLRIRCFFLGHDVWYSNSRANYESDRCNVCFKEEPREDKTIPGYLHSLYVWLVERDWKWFTEFDSWLDENYLNKLPKWMSY